MKFWTLRLHRWLALLFALPLLVVLATSLVLSFEPWMVSSAIKPGSLTADRVVALIQKHDPAGKEQAVTYRAYDNSIAIGGRSGAKIVDVATGEAKPALSGTAQLMLTARRMHETLLLDATSLVIASTFAMLAMALLGILMGWPRFANTVSGWHKGMAWGLLPLLVLSPLTGLFIAYGITFTPPPSGGAGAPLPLVEAVRVAGAKHDLSGLVWLRTQGKRQLLRVVEGGEYRLYAVSREGTRALPRNWPRLWHEGNFAGVWSALMNVIVSAASLALLVTGLWIWTGRKLRRRSNVRQRAAAA